MINKPKLKMMSDMTKLVIYQHAWLKLAVTWTHIKRFVVVVFEKVCNNIKNIRGGVPMDDREQYLLNEIARLRKENAELKEQIERYENEGGSFNVKEN